MFQGCTSLVNAPSLPATTLAAYCYYYMFYGCTSLVNAPALPATTLANDCYVSMFQGCTSLQVVSTAFTITTLPANALLNTFTGVGTGGTLYAGNASQPPTPTGWIRKTWAERPY
jgi:hypothetical protein